MSVFNGFSEADFRAFEVDGLDARMEALIRTVRPKLEAIGEILTPALSLMTGTEIFSHVAKHARRTVHPPDSTWVAWAADKRGYKKHPHFQVGLWRTHVFAWFALIYEFPNKAQFAARLREHLDDILPALPADYIWSTDHTKPETRRHGEMEKKDFAELIERLQHVKKTEVLCGIRIERNDPLLQDKEGLLKRFEETFAALLPLYKLAL
ncbi:YktB family protein [Bacillaceae bacterium]